MSDIFLDATVLGIDRAIGKLRRLERFRPDPLMQIVASTVKEQTVRHFENQAGEDGRWTGLAPSTRARRGGTAQILVDTGRLMGSIQESAFGAVAKVGTNVHYGKYHQFGTRKMPARAFLGLTGSDRGELEGIIEDYVVRMLA